MNSIRLAYGSLDFTGVGVLPEDLAGVDYLLLNGGVALGQDVQQRMSLLAQAFERLGPQLFLDPQLHVLVNLGGLAPTEAVEQIADALAKSGNFDLPMAVVRGADQLGRLEELMAASSLKNGVTGQPLAELRKPIVIAKASLGPRPTKKALGEGSRVVIVEHEPPRSLVAAAVQTTLLSEDNTEALRVAGNYAAKLISVYHSTEFASVDSSDLFVRPRLSVTVDADGQVSCQGPADVCQQAAKSERYAGHLDEVDQTDLMIVYEKGFRASWAITECEQGDGRIIKETLARWDAQPGCSSRIWHAPQGGGGMLATVEMAAEDESTVRKAFWRLRQVAMLKSFSGASITWGAEPSFQQELEVWPTTAPRESLPWSVDVRNARDWLDDIPYPS